MEALKAGVVAGVFERLALDAGPVLSLVCARAAGAGVPLQTHAPSHVSIFDLPTARIAFEVDADILPAVRIWSAARLDAARVAHDASSSSARHDFALIGYGYVFPDGVGRLYLRTSVVTADVRAAVLQLSVPCTCAAGHLLLHHLRAGAPAACTCGSAIVWLVCDDAEVRACRTAFAEAVTDQRQRVLSGARFTDAFCAEDGGSAALKA
jgi:hypothetical protein